MAIPFHLETTLNPPSFSHPLGCDAFGRDLGLVLLYSSLKSIGLALGVVLVTLIIANLISAFTAIAPKNIKISLDQILEFFLSFPSFLFAAAWAALFGPGWDTLSFSLLIGTLPGLLRLLRARSDEIFSEHYILASRATGATSFRIATRHLIPALIPFSWVKTPNLFSHALMAEATLSFLGLGAPIGSESWGSLLAQGKDYLIEAPHIAIGTGIPLVLTLISLQVLARKDYS